MNYIGSKKTLLPFLEDSILKIIENDENEFKNKTFLDLFAGTGAVGEHFKKLGFNIIANDIQYYSYVVNKNIIENSKQLKFLKLLEKIPSIKKLSKNELLTKNKNIKSQKLKVKKKVNNSEFQIEEKVCQYLNEIKSEKGFIYKNYSLQGTKNKTYQRIYFSDDNAKKIDAIRMTIEGWKEKKIVNENEYFFLLASLLKSADKVANTTSVYGAFLKKLKKSALTPLILTPFCYLKSKQKNLVFNQPIEDLITKIKGDILYLDPPYNARQYATNYHLLETIAKYDNPIVYGKTGLREYQRSKFCSKSSVLNSFKQIIDNANVKVIFVSYNNEGLMTFEEIKNIMSKRGDYQIFKKKYKTYKADSQRNNKSSFVTEYLHCVKVNDY